MTAETQLGFRFRLDSRSPPKNVTSKTYTYEGNDYTIMQYTRDMLCVGDPAENYKSVICDTEGNVLSVCPPKSVPSLSMDPKATIECTQLIEGTMMTLFMDPYQKEWNIHTRGAIGGNYFYYRNQYYLDQFSDARQVSYRDMFIEALGGTAGSRLADLEPLRMLDPYAVYTFTIQHPDNHIVLPIKTPRAYLTHVSYIYGNGFEVQCMTAHQAIKSMKFPTEFCIPQMYKMPTGVPVTDNYDGNSITYAINKYCGLHADYTQTGMAFYDTVSGKRYVKIAPSYEQMKKLRGNNPNLQYQYICLRRVRKVDEFLRYFPAYSRMFYKFYEQYREFMKGVHESYYDHYVKKKPVTISEKYMPYVIRLHREIYIPSIRTGCEEIISISRVYKFFDELSPGEVLYALNYDSRKITADCQKM